jgi:hypothetical protein
MLSSIYLTGDTIEAQSFAGQASLPDWRSFALSKLQRYGLKVVNPLELAWTNADLPDQFDPVDAVDQRVRRALDLIDQCDAVLANLTKSSYATAMEMFYAHRRGKMVTVIGQSPFNPWVLSHSQARFGDVDTALNYLIGEQPRSAPLNWILHYEALLAERYEQLPPAGEPDYKLLSGDIPILVLAPHATAYWREGEFEEAEPFTGSMAAVLNKISGCYSLLSNYCCVADPCYYLETPLRRAFTDIIRTGQIGLVIMLAGASWHEAPGLQITGTSSEPELCQDYVSRLKNKLAAIEPAIADGSDMHLSPLARFAAKELAVPTIVLKMHRRYRMPRLQGQLFSQLVGVLNDFIRDTGLELSRSLG